MKVLVIGYYTPGPYAEEAKKLVWSLRKYGIDYHMLAVPSFNSWNDAVAWKPHYIMSQLIGWGSYDGFLYVDVDAVFLEQPDWNEWDSCHLSCHVLKRSKILPQEYLTGTMYFAQTPTVHEFVREWAHLTAHYKNTDTPEQHSFKELIIRWGDRIIFKDMPPEYCFIFDEFAQKYPTLEPVIKHMQASRKYRFNDKKRKKMQRM